MPIKLKELIKTALSLLRVTIRSSYQVKIPKATQSNVLCMVFGNGPSLDEDIREQIDLIQKLDIFCVSRFAESDLYKMVRPKYYVFADPMFWATEAPEQMILIRNNLFDRIKNDTSWSLLICVPFEAKEFLNDIFSSSQNISLLFYNNVPLWGDKRILNMLFDRNLGMPPAQNVLISTLFLTLRMGYKNIVILGADHSWHETLALDNANRVCLRDRHFYDKDVGMRPFTMDGSEEKIFTMDALFYALGRMFEGYWKIAEYADRQAAQIINASSVTYIDAFKRKNISEVLVMLSKSK